MIILLNTDYIRNPQVEITAILFTIICNDGFVQEHGISKGL